MNKPRQTQVILKEYGRNIQKLVDYILTIEDRDKRSEYAKTLVELMRQLNPNTQEGQQENNRILWDHLYIMSNFQLDVDSEYDMPEPSVLGKKPMKVDYNQHNLTFRHYGKNIDLLVQKATEMEDPEERENTVIFIARLMKRFYVLWHKENPDDNAIIEHIKQLAREKLDVDFEKIKGNGSLEINLKNISNGNNYGRSNGGGKGRGSHGGKRKRKRR